MLDPNRSIYLYNTYSNKELKGITLGHDTEYKLDELVSKLKFLKIGTSPSGEINTLSYEEENNNILSRRGNKAPKARTRNYYPRPYFANVQFEEKK